MVSGCFGYRTVLIPALDLWDIMTPGLQRPRFHEDNQAMILVVMSGRNPTTRHTGRVHGVSVQWMNDRLGPHPDSDNVDIFYQDTNFMSADIYTKAFDTAVKWQHACLRINIFKPEDLVPDRLINGFEVGERMRTLPTLTKLCPVGLARGNRRASQMPRLRLNS